MRWALICLVVCLCQSTAFADRIDTQARRLRSDSYKVRVSAALQLSKSRDDRATVALSDSLSRDRNKTVRQVAAISLGKMIGPQTSARSRSIAVVALKRAAKSDGSSRVRRAARKSLSILAKSETEKAPSARAGSVFLHVGDPTDPTSRLSSSERDYLLRAVATTVRREAPTYGLATPSGYLPTEAELAAKRTNGFFLGVSVATLNVNRRGSRAEVRCQVKLRVGPWKGRDGGERIVAKRSASASGSARVVGRSSRRSVRRLQRDCVVAVAEEVTARQVMPFLRRASR